MTIRCDFRAIDGEAKSCRGQSCGTKLCAGAALMLGGLLLLIAP